jgi:hypothetical protein
VQVVVVVVVLSFLLGVGLQFGLPSLELLLLRLRLGFQGMEAGVLKFDGCELGGGDRLFVLALAGLKGELKAVKIISLLFHYNSYNYAQCSLIYLLHWPRRAPHLQNPTTNLRTAAPPMEIY